MTQRDSRIAGWTDQALRDLVTITTDVEVPKSDPSKPFIGMEHVDSNTGLVNGQGDPRSYSSAASLAGTGHVLYGRLRPYLNKVFIPSEEIFASREFIPMLPNEMIDSKFLQYRLLASDFVEFAVSLNAGDRPRVKWPQMAGYTIATPPIEEQRRIVEILDEQLSRLDAALESVRVVREKAAQFRRSLLHAAFIGELTTTGVDSIPASAWQRLTLNDVAKWGSGGTPKARTSAYYGGSIPWAVIGDLNDGIVESTAATITPEGLANSSAKVIEAGTVLVAMYGSIGKTGIAGMEMTTNQAIAFARPNEDVIERDYLLYYLQSQKEALAASGKGGTQKNISQTILKSWPVLVPPLQEQRKIADLIEASDVRQVGALEYVDGLGSHLAAIRRSLLHAAFTGELTASWRNSR